tara:strand:- start:87 stop:758 length:672 start_codon:yes stop_codon:yes gene_type:complete
MSDFIFNHSSNIHSDNGEDGINIYLLDLMGIDKGILLEIGAWDGFRSSNTAALWSRNNQFKSMLFEVAEDRLNKNSLEKIYSNVECFVSPVSIDNGLESFINTSKFEVTTDNFVLASIDVDGDDLNVAKSLGKYRPIIMIVEPNGNIFEKTNPEGVTAAEWNDYLEQHGYHFIGSSGKLNHYSGNLYFIRKDYSRFFEKALKKEWFNRGLLVSTPEGSGLLYG